jgi:hypothetical protein
MEDAVASASRSAADLAVVRIAWISTLSELWVIGNAPVAPFGVRQAVDIADEGLGQTATGS